jgi:hypothetical protein
LQEVDVWRTDGRDAIFQNSLVRPKVDTWWSPERFSSLKKLLNDSVPKGRLQVAALRRIDHLNPDTPLDGEAEMANGWADLAKSALDNDAVLRRARMFGARQAAPKAVMHIT